MEGQVHPPLQSGDHPPHIQLGVLGGRASEEHVVGVIEGPRDRFRQGPQLLIVPGNLGDQVLLDLRSRVR